MPPSGINCGRGARARLCVNPAYTRPVPESSSRFCPKNSMNTAGIKARGRVFAPPRVISRVHTHKTSNAGYLFGNETHRLGVRPCVCARERKKEEGEADRGTKVAAVCVCAAALSLSPYSRARVRHYRFRIKVTLASTHRPLYAATGRRDRTLYLTRIML